MKNSGSKLQIKAIFEENMHEITMDSAFRARLIALKENMKPLSPGQRFLEKEICLPLYPLSAAAAVLFIAAAALVSVFLLPGEVPQPEYRIIEMQATRGEFYRDGSYSNFYHEP